MRERLFLTSVMALLVASSAWAADVNGRWLAEIKNPNGSVSERIFTFTVAGDQVTGTIANRQVVQAIFEEKGKPKMVGTLRTQGAPAQPFAEGKISGNEISFVAPAMQGIKNFYIGKVSGAEIAFTMEIKWPEGYVSSAPNPADRVGPPKPQQFVAKRAGASD